MIVAQVHFGSKRDAEGELRRLERIDRFERASRAWIHIRFLEDVRVLGIDHKVDGLLENGLLTIGANDHVIGRLTRAETRDLAAFGHLPGSAALVFVHLFRFNFNH